MVRSTLKTAAITALLVSLSMANAGHKLNTGESHATRLAKAWMNNGIRAIGSGNGSVVFMYGLTMPTIVTAPLRLTDIRLEPGEKIKEIQLGDTVRWIVSPSISGEGQSRVSHVIIKPADAGLQTTMVVLTDRRTYVLTLKSTKKDYMPIVSFQYPEKIRQKIAEYERKVAQQQKRKEFWVTDTITRNIDQLDFGYKIEGDYFWRPVRVYNDGVHTYIQLPQKVKFKEAPVLLVLDGEKEKMVNYRLKGDRLIVDNLFEKAVLIKGVGQNQERVEVIYKKATKPAEALKVLEGEQNGL